jgi:hypothetical protein
MNTAFFKSSTKLLCRSLIALVLGTGGSAWNETAAMDAGDSNGQDQDRPTIRGYTGAQQQDDGSEEDQINSFSQNNQDPQNLQNIGNQGTVDLYRAVQGQEAAYPQRHRDQEPQDWVGAGVLSQAELELQKELYANFQISSAMKKEEPQDSIADGIRDLQTFVNEGFVSAITFQDSKNPFGFSPKMYDLDVGHLAFANDTLWGAMHAAGENNRPLDIGLVNFHVSSGRNQQEVPFKGALISVCKDYKGDSVHIAETQQQDYHLLYQLLPPAKERPWEPSRHGKTWYLVAFAHNGLQPPNHAYPVYWDESGTTNCSAFQECTRPATLTLRPMVKDFLKQLFSN